MSCLHPILVYNRTKSYGKGTDKVVMKLPCGKCAECRRAQQQQWALRAYELMQEFKEKGGMVMFPTFTYSNPNLPYFDYKDDTHSYHIPCFEKAHYEKFMNSLRKYYERKGIKGIKVLFCCEFGSKTQRPHYHALIYLPNGITEREAKKKFQEYWPYGYVMYSPLGAVIDSIEGCTYVSKYVCKDIDFFDRADLKSYMATYSNDDERMQAIKEHLPKHWQSQGFGKGLADKLLNLNEEKLFTTFRDGYRVPMTETYLPIPRYVYDKIMYQVDKNGHRTPTDTKKRFEAWNFDYDIERIARNLEQNTSIKGLEQYVASDEQFPTVFPDLVEGGIDTIEALHNRFEQIRNGIDFKDLALYKKVFRGYAVLDSKYYDMLGIPEEDNLYDHAKRLYIGRLAIPTEVKLNDEDGYFSDKKNREEEHDYLYDRMIEFQPFVEFIDLLEFVQTFGYRKQSKAKVTQEKALKKLREIFKEKV